MKDIPEWAMEKAENLSHLAGLSDVSGKREIARALVEAEARGMERCASIFDEQARELSVYRDQWPLRDEYKRIAATIRKGDAP